MKKIIISIVLAFSLLFGNCNAGNPTDTKNNIVSLTNATFKQKVFNYELNKDWKFEGDKPVIIDFYASWCGPCRQLSPILDALSKEYDGKIVFYKVDTDAEQALAQSMGITSLPTLLFVPVKGKPQITMGALPKETLVKVINEVLSIK